MIFSDYELLFHEHTYCILFAMQCTDFIQPCIKYRVDDQESLHHPLMCTAFNTYPNSTCDFIDFTNFKDNIHRSHNLMRTISNINQQEICTCNGNSCTSLHQYHYTLPSISAIANHSCSYLVHMPIHICLLFFSGVFFYSF